MKYIIRKWVDVPYDTMIETELSPEDALQAFSYGDNSNIKILVPETEILEHSFVEDYMVIMDENENTLFEW